MSMPNDLILIRHGQSEANIIQSDLRSKPDQPAPDGYFDRHDSHMRLSKQGQKQAKAAGEWLRTNGFDKFDRYYVSPHIRARETAAHLKLNGDWRVDDRWREQDWGEFNIMDPSTRLDRHPYSSKLQDLHAWYWCPPGGESRATEVRLRFESVLGSLHREMSGKRVIAITHGEFLVTAQFVLERMVPEDFFKRLDSTTHRIHNCQIFHYSRINPHTGDQEPYLKWRRVINPYDSALSWQNGEWIELKPRVYSDEELLESVKVHARFLQDQGL